MSQYVARPGATVDFRCGLERVPDALGGVPIRWSFNDGPVPGKAQLRGGDGLGLRIPDVGPDEAGRLVSFISRKKSNFCCFAQ